MSEYANETNPAGHQRQISYPAPIAVVLASPSSRHNYPPVASHEQQHQPDHTLQADNQHYTPSDILSFPATTEKDRQIDSGMARSEEIMEFDRREKEVINVVPISHLARSHHNDVDVIETASMLMTERQMKNLIIKNHFLAFVGEFVGTFLFMYFALGATNAANLPSTALTGNVATSSTTGDPTTILNTSSLLYIALAFGFSLAICAWIFFRVSGGLFNPAVSLGLALVGVITPFRAALLTVSQCLGAIAGAGFVQLTLPGDLNAATRLSSDTSLAQGFFIEAFCTSLLMFAVLFLAAEKSRATFLAPIGIGLALFIGELVGVLYTGGALNPARALGPNVILSNFDKHHWIYWVGPALGATVAAGFYKAIKLMHFETVVPGQDDDGSAAALLAENAGPTGMPSSGPLGPRRAREPSLAP